MSIGDKMQTIHQCPQKKLEITHNTAPLERSTIHILSPPPAPTYLPPPTSNRLWSQRNLDSNPAFTTYWMYHHEPTFHLRKGTTSYVYILSLRKMTGALLRVPCLAQSKHFLNGARCVRAGQREGNVAGMTAALRGVCLQSWPLAGIRELTTGENSSIS